MKFDFYFLKILFSLFFSQNQTKSQISLMYERAKQLGLSVQIEHNEPLTVTYYIGEKYTTTGTGQTKHEAKQTAAEKMLEILPIPDEKSKQKSIRKHSHQHKKFIEQKGSNNYSLSEEINPITRLYQIGRAREKKIEFIQINNPENEKIYHFHVIFGENDFADGYDKSKQAAKRSAAENLLLKLNPEQLELTTISLPPPPKKGLLKREENLNKQQEKKHVHFNEDQLITTKQRLKIQCNKYDIQIQYDDEFITNQYESILSLTKDKQLIGKFRGKALELMDAQENASEIAWKHLYELFNELNTINL